MRVSKVTVCVFVVTLSVAVLSSACLDPNFAQNLARMRIQHLLRMFPQLQNEFGTNGGMNNNNNNNPLNPLNNNNNNPLNPNNNVNPLNNNNVNPLNPNNNVNPLNNNNVNPLNPNNNNNANPTNLG